MNEYSRIGARIKRARELADMTQAQLAEKIRVSRDVIANYESNRIPNGPPIGRLVKIAHACGVKLIWLLKEVISDDDANLS